jgi:hypothetical protein
LVPPQAVGSTTLPTALFFALYRSNQLTRSSRAWLDFHRREPNFNRESDLLRHREPCSISNIGNQTSIANQPFNVIASLAGRESNSQIEIIAARRGDPHRHSSAT